MNQPLTSEGMKAGQFHDWASGKTIRRTGQHVQNAIEIEYIGIAPTAHVSDTAFKFISVYKGETQRYHSSETDHWEIVENKPTEIVLPIDKICSPETHIKSSEHLSTNRNALLISEMIATIATNIVSKVKVKTMTLYQSIVHMHEEGYPDEAITLTFKKSQAILAQDFESAKKYEDQIKALKPKSEEELAIYNEGQREAIEYVIRKLKMFSCSPDYTIGDAIDWLDKNFMTVLISESNNNEQ